MEVSTWDDRALEKQKRAHVLNVPKYYPAFPLALCYSLLSGRGDRFRILLSLKDSGVKVLRLPRPQVPDLIQFGDGVVDGYFHL